MKYENVMFTIVALWLVIVVGCASVGKFTPQGAAGATYAAELAGKLLYTVDTIYPLFMGAKQQPEFLQKATQQLAQLDVLAPALKQVIAGASITDEKLNAMAGQVAGSQEVANMVVK